MAPICEGWRADLRRQLDGIEQKMRLQGSRPASADWEARLGQLRLAQLDIKEGDCGATLELGSRALALDNDVFTASLADAPIPSNAKLASAERSDVAEAIALARQLLSGPRPLTVLVSTPADERYAGRQIAFGFGNLDPVWQAGVTVGVDFGDGSPPLLLDAEALRRRRSVTHVFAGPVTGTVKVVAATRFRPGTLTVDARCW